MRPYVKSSKNDARDAEAICEAVTRPSMRFVVVKSQAQQDMLALHRIRALLIRERTALMNQVRGLLAERGIVVAQGEAQLRRALAELLGDHDEHVGELLREALAEMNERLGLLEERLSVWPADREVRATRIAPGSRREGEPRSALKYLLDAELIYARGIPPEATYQFKHALIQDVAYEALLKPRRRELHHRVAETISEKFAAIAEEHPEVIARHWTEAGETEPTIAGWRKAADAASEPHAFKEAEEAYRQTLTLLRNLPESRESDDRELK